MKASIRRASIEDIDAIVGTHRASVTKLCAKDYRSEQISAWTAKHSTDAGKQRWADKIHGDFVWVLESDGEVCGFAHFRFTTDIPIAGYLNALYLTPSAAGQGHGKRLLDAIEQECAARTVSSIRTHATKNALGFYERMGFKRNGGIYVVSMSGVGIESFPMEKDLGP